MHSPRGLLCTPCTAVIAMRASSTARHAARLICAIVRSRRVLLSCTTMAFRIGAHHERGDIRRGSRGPGTDVALQLVLLRGYFSAGKGTDLLPRMVLCRPRGAAAEAWGLHGPRYSRREHPHRPQSSWRLARVLQRLPPSWLAAVSRRRFSYVGRRRAGRGGRG